eukprot:gene16821-8454_t
MAAGRVAGSAGRRRPAALLLLLCIATQVLSAAARSYAAFVALRALNGAAVGGFALVMY